MPAVGTLLRTSAKVAGLLLALALLPSTARAQCNHAAGRAVHGDLGGFVPVSRHAKNDTEKAENRKPAAPDKTPAKHRPCQGCFDCGQNPASAPTSTAGGFEILDLLELASLPLENLSCSAWAGHSPNLNRQQPVYSIKHPPRLLCQSI